MRNALSAKPSQIGDAWLFLNNSQIYSFALLSTSWLDSKADLVASYPSYPETLERSVQLKRWDTKLASPQSNTLPYLMTPPRSWREANPDNKKSIFSAPIAIQEHMFQWLHPAMNCRGLWWSRPFQVTLECIPLLEMRLPFSHSTAICYPITQLVTGQIQKFMQKFLSQPFGRTSFY